MSERELVGMVVPTVDNSFFANLAYYAERFLYDEGYAMLLCSSANSAEKEKTYLRTLAQTGVKGILCVSGLSAVESGLLPENVPLVWVDRHPASEEQIPWVANDDREAMREATEYLLNKAIGAKYFGVRAAITDVLKENPTDSKQELLGQIEAAGGLDGVLITESKVTFTFPAGEPEANRAYTELAAAMLKKAKEASRVKAEYHSPENEKYYFRSFIVSIGFGGADKKEARKELLKNLKGHSAFKNDEEAEKFKAAMKEKRRLEKEGGAE